MYPKRAQTAGPRPPCHGPTGKGVALRNGDSFGEGIWIIKPKAGNYCKSCGDGLCRATTIYCRALLYIRAVRQRQMTRISFPVRGNAYWTPGINIYETSMPIISKKRWTAFVEPSHVDEACELDESNYGPRGAVPATEDPRDCRPCTTVPSAS